MNTENNASTCMGYRYTYYLCKLLKPYLVLLLFAIISTNGFSNNKETSNHSTPRVRYIKSVQQTENLDNGNLAILYRIGIKNTGDGAYNSLDINFNAAEQIGAAFVGLPGMSPDISIISTSASITPQINNNYNGDSNTKLFKIDAPVLLDEDEELIVYLFVEVNPFLVSWPMSTQVSGIVQGFDSAGNNIQAEDLSDSGLNFLGNNPGAPGDQGTADDATELTCNVANVGISVPEKVCPGEIITLDVSTAIADPNYTWRILGESGVFSNEQNPSSGMIDTATTFLVTAASTDGSCFYDVRDTKQVALFEVPTVEPAMSVIIDEECAPSTISFNANASAGDTTVASYIWLGGNYGWASIQSDPVITYAHSFFNGVYVVEAIDLNGCKGVGSIEVTGAYINSEEGGTGLVPLISSDLDCEEIAVEGIEITAPNYQADGQVTTFEWVTPDGVTNNIAGLDGNKLLIQPVDFSTHQGEYSVKISVGDCEFFSDTFNLEVFDVIANPSVVIESNDVLCEGGAFKILANVENADSYEWTGPNGFTSNIQNPIISNVTTAENGTYTLTAYSSQGCSISQSLEMNEVGSPPATPTLTGDAFICENEIINLSANETYSNTATYAWINGSGTTIGNNPQLNINANTPNAISPFRLQVTDGDCGSSLSEDFAVATTLIPDVSITSSVEGNTACVGQSVQLNANSISGGTYEWRIQGNSTVISTDQNPVFIPTTDEVTYELSVDYPACATTINEAITITTEPGLGIDANAGFDVDGSCVPVSINLFSDVVFGTSTTLNYQWSGPNGFTSAQANPVIGNISASNNGEYTLLVSTAEGCTATSLIAVNNNFEETTQPSISVGASDLCEGGSTILNATEYLGDNVSYQWTTPNGVTTNISGQTTSALNINSLSGDIHNGEYTVTVMIGSCTLNSEVYNLETTLAPEITISNSIGSGPACEGESVQLEATAIPGATYEWRISGSSSVISTLRNPIFTPLGNSVTYEVSVFEPGCSTTSIATINVSVSSAIALSASADYTLDGSCVPTTINLSGIVNSNTDIASYQWSGPNGFTSAQANPVIGNINASNNGEYTLLVSTSAGCTATSTIQVNNNFEETTQPSISVGASDLCEGGSTILNATEYLGDNVSYQWTTPNGVTTNISGQTTSALNINSLSGDIHNGEYTVTVMIGSCTLNSEVYNLETTLAPEITISNSIGSGPACEGESVQLEATAISGATYEWRISGSSSVISTLRNPVFTPLENTVTYEVSVFEPGCSTTSIATINVSVSSAIALSASADYTLDGSCVPTTINLSGTVNSNTDITSYQWSGPNGFTSAQANPVIGNISASNNGEYTLLVSTAEGCTATSLIAVNNNFEETTQPIISVGASDLCEGGSTILNATEYLGDNVSYQWTTPNGVTTNISGQTTSALNINSLSGDIHNGEYTVTVMIGSCTLNSEVYNLETTLAPEITISNSIGSGPACEGESVQLEATAISGATYEWRISGSSSVISTLRNPVFTPLENTVTYEVSVFEPGCSTTSTATINVSVSSAIALSASAEYTLDGNCVPTTINLSGTTIGNPQISSYDWIGPNGFSSSLINPTVENITTANNGTYTLTITNNDGCTATSSLEVANSFDGLATPIISSDVPVACVSESITLSVSNYSGDNVTYLWTTPGGTSSGISGFNSNQLTINNLSPSVHDGSYFISIEVDDCTIISNDFILETAALPQISPAVEGNGVICAGTSLQLIANAVNATDFFWTGPNGFTSITENPIINNANVSNNGTYTLSAIGQGACTVEASFTLNSINSAPETPSIANTQLFVCEGTSFDLEVSTDYPPGTVTYEWTNNFGTIIGTDKILTLMAGAAVAVPPFNLTVSNGECEVNALTPVFVEVIESPDFTIGSLPPVCEGSDVLLTTSSVPDATYEWSVLNDPTVFSNDQNPSVNNLTETTTFELTVSAQGCTASSQTALVVVNSNPVIEPTQSYTLNADCSPSDLNLFVNAETLGDFNLTYNWTGPNGFQSGLPNPVIPDANTTNNGSYVVLVTSDAGCFTNGAVNVSGIADSQEAPVITSNTTSFCDDQTIVLSVPVYEGNVVEYEWTLPMNIIYDNLNNELIINNANPNVHNGNYSLTVQVDGCVLTSETFTLEVGSQPEVEVELSANGEVCSGGTLSFDVNATNVNSYQWTGPNGFNSNQAQPIIENTSVENNGIYSLTVSNSNGCSVTETIEVNSIVGIPQAPILSNIETICEGEEITLSILQSYVGDVDYNWFNGAGIMISNATVLSIDADDEMAISPFYAMVTVDGCDSEVSGLRTFDLAESPIAVANSISSACLGNAVQLSADEIDGGNYFWYDSDPIASTPPATIISTQHSPLINNLGIGNHTFYLKVENENGCASQNIAETNVEILAQPVFSDVIGEGVYCEGQTVILSAVNIVDFNEPINYTWSGPNEFEYDGVSVDGENFTLSILDFDQSLEGIYTLEATINNECVTAPVSAFIQFSEVPETPTLSISNDVFCTGESLTLIANSIPGNVQYEWYFTDATGTTLIDVTEFPTIVLDDLITDNSGVYSVGINIDGGCPSDLSNSETVSVLDVIEAPSVSNTTTLETPACEQEMVSLSASFIQGATYYWYGPDGGFISEGSGLVLMDVGLEDAGAYFVVAELGDCPSVISEETIVYISEAPQAPTLQVNAACVGGEIALSIQGPIIIPPNATVVYEWYYQTTGSPFAVTSVPELIIENASEDDNGTYFVLVSTTSCRSAFSNVVEVEVGAVPNEEAIAGEDQSECEGALINLEAEMPDQSIGFWYSPTGASVENIADPNTAVSNLEAGENMFVWSLAISGCDPFDMDTVIININETASQMAFAGDNIDLCDESILSLDALELPNTIGTWTQPISQFAAGVSIADSSMSNTEVTGLQVGNTYTFYWTVYDEVCDQYSEDEVEVIVSAQPANAALVPESLVYNCGDDIASIVAIEPGIGFGTWTTNSSTASISNPNDAVMLVGDLEEGATQFVWSLSFGACKDYSSDTLTLINEATPQVNGDSYSTPFRESIISEDLLLNDDLGNINSWTVEILEQPSNGQLSDNILEGIMDYTPDDDSYGSDQFVYEICNLNCPSDCDSATVSIGVIINEDNDCWIPDVVTPNNDGLNDVLEIPCIANYPNNQLMIYNRSGDKVFEENEYSNNWGGTFRGSELPPGTYYYFLTLEPGTKAIKGFLTLVR